MTKIDCWEPLLDMEWEALHRAMPELKAERREDRWWVRITGSGINRMTEQDGRRLLRLVIAEELAGHGLDEVPKAN